MRALPCFLYDAFAERRFGGNVAGVALLDAPLAGTLHLSPALRRLA